MALPSMVRADQIDKARLASTAQGPISSGRMGFELFDKPNWSGSDFSEKTISGNPKDLWKNLKIV